MFSCLDASRQRGQQPQEMTGGGIAVGVGSYDDCDAGDALHIEMAHFEMRSQAQPMPQLACEGGGYAGTDLRKHRRSLRVGGRNARSEVLIVPVAGRSTRLRQARLTAVSTRAGVETVADHHADDVDVGFATDLPEWRPGAVF